jgi:hypothetical protein
MVNTDLKDVGQRAYPPELFKRALQGCRAAAMTNIGFSRPLVLVEVQAGCFGR